MPNKSNPKQKMVKQQKRINKAVKSSLPRVRRYSVAKRKLWLSIHPPDWVNMNGLPKDTYYSGVPDPYPVVPGKKRTY